MTSAPGQFAPSEVSAKSNDDIATAISTEMGNDVSSTNTGEAPDHCVSPFAIPLAQPSESEPTMKDSSGMQMIEDEKLKLMKIAKL